MGGGGGRRGCGAGTIQGPLHDEEEALALILRCTQQVSCCVAKLGVAAAALILPKMNIPKLQINETSCEAVEAEETKQPISATRKSLHQNIFGKLRPLPFQYHWTVWYDKHTDGGGHYDDRLYVLHEDVADIATFYRVYNNYPWEKVRLRDTVHIFRKGVKPVWEDPANLGGGCWKFRVPKTKAQAFFHEIAILCMANEFQAVLEKGMRVQHVLFLLLLVLTSICARS